MEQTENLGWIGTSEENESVVEQQIIYFRKTLVIDIIPESFYADITADAKYKLFVNGNFVNVGPQKGDKQIWYYDTLDLIDFLKLGNNIIVVEVLTIPDRPRTGPDSFSRTGTPGLYFKSSGNIIADSSWKWKKAPVSLKPETEDGRFAHLNIFEVALGAEFNGPVFKDGFDDSSWENAFSYNPFVLNDVLRPDNLALRTIPLIGFEDKRFTGAECIRQSDLSMQQWDSLLQSGTPVQIPAHSREVVEISAGTETTGFLNLKMSGGAGSKFKILTSECYAYEPIEGLGGPIMPRKGDRTDSENGQLYGFTDTYHVAGLGDADSPEIYEPFWFRAFRFIQLTIETGDEPLILSDLSYKYFSYPLDVKTSVKTSDTSLEKVWDICERSLRLCMHETYEDTPFYEQLQYAMDTRSQILYTYAVAADDRLARQAMDDFRRSMRYDGMISCSHPNNIRPVIPGFGIYYIAMIYDHMMYFGDKQLIKEHMPAILGVLGFFRNSMEDSGLVGKIGGPLFQARFWSFIDWTAQWRDNLGVPSATHRGPLTMESFYYITALQHAAALFGYIGYSELSRQLDEESKNIQSAVNRLCRGKGGMYTDGPGVEDYSQHTQVFAILTGTVDIETGRKYLRETLDKPEQYAQCSVAMMYYLFRALEKCDLYKRTNELWNVWRDMVEKNLTTCEEDPVSSRSDCHAWGALALYELPSVVLGIRPSAPGFSEIDFNPKPGHLKHAEGSVITPRGRASVSWTTENGGLEVKASIPEGIKIKGGTEREGFLFS